MTLNPTLKIVEPGKSLNSTDPRDFKVWLPNCPCLKIHEVKSGSTTINAGGTSGSVTISHNLGYVPAFLVYKEDYGWELFPNGTEAYATTSSIVITTRLAEPYNQETVEYLYHPAQYWYEYPGSVDSVGMVVSGTVLSHVYQSAMWFQNIYVPQGKTIDSASFEFKDVFTAGSNDIKFKIFGIDEDDTADLGGGFPGGRPKTDNYNTKTQSQIHSTFNFGDNFKNIVQEIVNRGGWSSGNSMAFTIENNGTENSEYMAFLRSGFTNDKLELTISYTDITPGTLTTNYKVVILKDKIA